MEKISCGILGFGFYFPETVRDYEEISRLSGVPAEVVRDKLGINRVYYTGANETTTEMAIAAAKDCLEKTGVDPKEIDLLIYFGENYADHLIYCIGPKILHEIGATNAWCYSMEMKCGSAVIALEQARKYMETDPEINTVMLAGGYRNNDKVDYTDNGLSFFYNLSSGGAACILKKGYERRNFLSAAEIVDGSYADTIIIPYGGQKHPITAENLNDRYGHYFRLEDPVAFRERLGKITMSNLVKAQERALAKSGLTTKDLDLVCPLHMNVKAHRTLMQMLDIPEEQSFYLREYGHVGQCDPLLSLALAEEQGMLKEGDIAGVIAMGIGYLWVGAAFRW